jgi:hypothetical protein
MLLCVTPRNATQRHATQQGDLVSLSGRKPERRQEDWDSKRVFFCTNEVGCAVAQPAAGAASVHCGCSHA